MLVLMLACTHSSCACASAERAQLCEVELGALHASDSSPPPPPQPTSREANAVAVVESILKVRRPGTVHTYLQLLGKYWRARANGTNVTNIGIDEWPTDFSCLRLRVFARRVSNENPRPRGAPHTRTARHAGRRSIAYSKSARQRPTPPRGRGFASCQSMPSPFCRQFIRILFLLRIDQNRQS
jgi:hypothetical protein